MYPLHAIFVDLSAERVNFCIKVYTIIVIVNKMRTLL